MSKTIISRYYNNNSSSFTLIELLVVIAILAILMAVVVVTINPAEILKKTRDTKRFNDLSNLQELLQLANSEGLLTPSICDGTKIYISLPNSISLSNTNLPAGVSWQQVSEADLRNSNGTGWIPINLSGSYTSGFSMASLPVDPQNTLNDNLYYTFYCNPQQEYILTSYMESKTFGPKGNETSKTNKDGGPDPYLYEVGSDLFISPLKPVASWSFDEGAGTIANDSSGNNNNGILYGNPTWTTEGQVNKALSFDGSNDYVDCGNDESLNLTSVGSVEVWANIKTYSNYPGIVSKGAIGGWDTNGYGIWLWEGKVAGTITNKAENPNHITFSFGSPAINKWNHYVLVWDGSYVYGYFNGIEVFKQTQTLNVPITSYNLELSHIASTAFNGLIDEVRIYNRALSAEEIKRHYEMSK